MNSQYVTSVFQWWLILLCHFFLIDFKHSLSFLNKQNINILSLNIKSIPIRHRKGEKCSSSLAFLPVPKPYTNKSYLQRQDMYILLYIIQSLSFGEVHVWIYWLEKIIFMEPEGHCEYNFLPPQKSINPHIYRIKTVIVLFYILNKETYSVPQI